MTFFSFRSESVQDVLIQKSLKLAPAINIEDYA